MSGNRKESIISEYQSFTHLTYSKNKDPIHPEYVLQAPFEVFSFQYNPSNPDIIAGGCYNGQTCVSGGGLMVGCMIQPEQAFRILHGSPHAMVVLWDTTHEHERIARMKAASNKQETQDAGDEAAIPIVKCKYATTIEFSHHCVTMDLQCLPVHYHLVVLERPSPYSTIWLSGDASPLTVKCSVLLPSYCRPPLYGCRYATTIEFSHHHVIMDLQWLPGIEISTRGKVTKADPRECSFLATTSGDGKDNLQEYRCLSTARPHFGMRYDMCSLQVNFWDVRVERLMKKGRKAEDSLELIWKPTHSIHIISLIGLLVFMPFGPQQPHDVSWFLCLLVLMSSVLSSPICLLIQVKSPGPEQPPLPHACETARSMHHHILYCMQHVKVHVACTMTSLIACSMHHRNSSCMQHASSCHNILHAACIIVSHAKHAAFSMAISCQACPASLIPFIMDLGGLHVCFRFLELDKGPFEKGLYSLTNNAFTATGMDLKRLHTCFCFRMDLGGLRMCFNFRELDKGAFFVGSADGELAYAEFVRPEGEENPEYTKSCVQAHVAPIMALERSPFFDDIILTVGDWSFQIWREGHTSPLFTSGYGAEMYTCGFFRSDVPEHNKLSPEWSSCIPEQTCDCLQCRCVTMRSQCNHNRLSSVVAFDPFLSFPITCKHTSASRAATMQLKKMQQRHAAKGCWSPSRPAVIYLTDQAGNLEVWDMLDRSHEPSIKVWCNECVLSSHQARSNLEVWDMLDRLHEPWTKVWCNECVLYFHGPSIQAGNLGVWDMQDCSQQPSVKVTLASTPFMSMSFMGTGSGSTSAAAPAASSAAGAGPSASAVAQQQQQAGQFLALGDSWFRALGDLVRAVVWPKRPALWPNSSSRLADLLHWHVPIFVRQREGMLRIVVIPRTCKSPCSKRGLKHDRKSSYNIRRAGVLHIVEIQTMCKKYCKEHCKKAMQRACSQMQTCCQRPTTRGQGARRGDSPQLAAAHAVGVLRIVEIPRNLRRPMQSERKAMAAFLEREGERVADVEARKPLRDKSIAVAEEARKKAALSVSEPSPMSPMGTRIERKGSRLAVSDKHDCCCLDVPLKVETDSTGRVAELRYTSGHWMKLKLLPPFLPNILQDEAEAAAKDSAAQKDQPNQPASPTKTTAKSAAHLAALELDEKAEAEYFKLEHRLKVQLGLIEEAEAESPRR
ncbi:hypothetical protein DUNSADRAFT_5963 [Dunaliella salina]|uniref:Uncharacterized protein n=1 Tax=Dunaliella salina TaxID=3046 RepID=A0ABQ7GP60_DUNSA|nr:hypothetical protein DUNSADRAFT_5963 [Dunaliella salina]|eukprot:KAF5836394.1 hypothetical protein DUNSADRAFT_5963 [Dunaliella salina]